MVIGAGPTLNLEAPRLFVQAEAIRTTAKIRRPNLRAPWTLLKSLIGVFPQSFNQVSCPYVASDTKSVEHGHSDLLLHALFIPCLSRLAGLTLDPIPCNYVNTSAQLVTE